MLMVGCGTKVWCVPPFNVHAEEQLSTADRPETDQGRAFSWVPTEAKFAPLIDNSLIFNSFFSGDPMDPR
jgi:hypothetical protein